MNDPSRTMRLAGVDIGAFTCRLLIADLPHGGRQKEVRSERRILRLGEGIDQTSQLSNAAGQALYGQHHRIEGTSEFQLRRGLTHGQDRPR